jgi:TonB-dependent starch-binding outer membrane protein SusC
MQPSTRGTRMHVITTDPRSSMLKVLHVFPVLLALALSVAGAQRPDTTLSILTQDPVYPDRCTIPVGAIGAVAASPRCERGIAMAIIDSTDGISTAPSLPLALQARVPGVSVTEGEGYRGSTSRVWLRGPSSFLVNQPLLIIDGIRTHAAGPYRGFEDRALPSRLEDIDPETIERIAILPGIASSAIYGPGASKGVILVTTKRGVAGPTRWSAFAESGPLIEPTTFPPNFGTAGVSTTTGNPVVNCPLVAQADGFCTPTTRRSWNPLERVSPFRTGWNNGAGVSAWGGTSTLVYRGFVDHERATGVYDQDRGDATNGRINLAMSPASSVNVRLIAGYRIEHLDHPPDNYLRAGLLGESADDPVNHGYRFLDPEAVESGTRAQNGSRTNVALSGDWSPRPWLRTSALVGYDRLAVEQLLTVTRDATPIPGIPGSGGEARWRTRTHDSPSVASGGIEATASYGTARTTVGLQHIREDDRGDSHQEVGGGLPFEASSAMHTKRASTGLYVQQHMGWRDRLFLTGTARGDLMRAGSGMKVFSSSIDAAWLIVGRVNGAAARGWLDELRLRSAYGIGGGHLIPTVEANFFGEPSGMSKQTAERMKELEVGIDASMLSDRLSATVTWYRGTNDQGLTSYLAPTSGGPQVVVLNDARFRTTGLATSIDARLIERSAFAWDLGLAVFANDDEILHLPGPPGVTANEQYLAEGERIGGYRRRPYSYTDVNGDGKIASSEVTYDDVNLSTGGSPVPSHEAALRTELRIGGRVHLRAVVDRRGGQKLLNQVGVLRCRSQQAQCEEQHDPATSLEDQAGAVAARNSYETAYLEDASYTKLREVALEVALPGRLAAMGGASGARLTLSGRNLHTWTSYRGLDPEIVSDDQETFAAAGGFYQPPLRAFSARIDISW